MIVNIVVYMLLFTFYSLENNSWGIVDHLNTVSYTHYTTLHTDCILAAYCSQYGRCCNGEIEKSLCSRLKM